LAVEKQVVIIYAVINDYLVDVPPKKVGDYEADLFRWLDSDAPGMEIIKLLKAEQNLTKEIEEKIKAGLESFTENFISQN
jgi:F-type H+-transporting ATPase subunit alpha